MMLTLRAASFLFVVLRSHAARADRNDGIADAVARAEPPTLEGKEEGLHETAVTPPSTGALGSDADVETPASGANTPAKGASVHAEHFEKTVAHTEQIKAAVDRVHVKTQVAKEAAVAVKDSFGRYQGTINDLKGQLDSVDGVAHKFEDEVWEHLAKDESTRLQPFEEYKKQFGDVEGVEEAEEPTVGASAEQQSFLESGRYARHSSSNDSATATGGNRFEKSVQQSEQIKVAVGKVKEKVELAKQAAARVKQGFEDYKGKVAEVRNQLNEVDNQQHEYHGKLLNHYDGQEGDRMSAFDNPPSLESDGNAGPSTTAEESGLLQSRERGQLSKEHVSVTNQPGNGGGGSHR